MLRWPKRCGPLLNPATKTYRLEDLECWCARAHHARLQHPTYLRQKSAHTADSKTSANRMSGVRDRCSSRDHPRGPTTSRRALQEKPKHAKSTSAHARCLARTKRTPFFDAGSPEQALLSFVQNANRLRHRKWLALASCFLMDHAHMLQTLRRKILSILHDELAHSASLRKSPSMSAPLLPPPHHHPCLHRRPLTMRIKSGWISPNVHATISSLRAVGKIGNRQSPSKRLLFKANRAVARRKERSKNARLFSRMRCVRPRAT